MLDPEGYHREDRRLFLNNREYQSTTVTQRDNYPVSIIDVLLEETRKES